MTPTDFATFLVTHNACQPARDWSAGMTAQQAWETCSRGDWLLWLAEEANVERKLLVLAACDCARTALPYAGEAEAVSRHAIETTEAWCRGEATIEQVKSAAEAAAGAASRAACAATETAAGAAAGAAGAADHQQCTDLVRARIPWAVVEKALEGTP